jgi:hypothetical protein
MQNRALNGNSSSHADANLINSILSCPDLILTKSFFRPLDLRQSEALAVVRWVFSLEMMNIAKFFPNDVKGISEALGLFGSNVTCGWSSQRRIEKSRFLVGCSVSALSIDE